MDENSEVFEQAVAQAVRHVAEGKQRLARQRELIDRLERDGHTNMLPEARSTLADMERLQKEMERHVTDQRRLLADYKQRNP